MNTINWKNATPEQLNLWQNVKGLIAYTAITPIYYQGVIAGSEFLTYNAGKLYIALDLSFNGYGIANTGVVTLYNMADAVCLQLNNLNMAWDTTAALMKFTINTIQTQNLYFSRIITTTYSHLKFNGYRLTV